MSILWLAFLNPRSNDYEDGKEKMIYTLTFCILTTGSFSKPDAIQRSLVTAIDLGDGVLLLESRFPIMDAWAKTPGRMGCWVAEYSQDRRMAIVRFRSGRTEADLIVELWIGRYRKVVELRIVRGRSP